MVYKKPIYVKRSGNRENKTEKYLVEQVQKLGGECYKTHSPGMSGFPDRMCIFPNRFICFIELKSEGKIPKNHQQVVINRLMHFGFPVYVIDSRDIVDTFIELCKKQLSIYTVTSK